MKKKIAFKTLGCRLNQYETDSLRAKFIHQKYTIVPFDKKADVYVINSCTVTSTSDKKVKYYIEQIAKKKKKYNSTLFLIGCINKPITSNSIIDYILKNDEKSALFEVVESHFLENGKLTLKKIGSNAFSYPSLKYSARTRRMVKIQEGCDKFCSFCIIPQVRGRAISRNYKEIVTNVKRLIDFGFKEIIITGVNIAQYNSNGKDLTALLSTILSIKGDFRIRISSIEPTIFPDEFYQLFYHRKLTPFLHLCLQSGSDKILKLMRRNYIINDYYAIVEKLRKVKPNINISTDIMVGFPNEDETDFAETLQIMKEIQFAKVHIFRFSKRDNTLANRLPQQIDEKIKKYRYNHIKQLADSTSLKYKEKFINKKLTVLVENTDNDKKHIGYSENYLPIFLNRKIPLSKNDFYKVSINQLDSKQNLIGTIIQ